MPLGMEVGLSPGGIVLDGDRDPPLQKGSQLTTDMGRKLGGLCLFEGSWIPI